MKNAGKVVMALEDILDLIGLVQMGGERRTPTLNMFLDSPHFTGDQAVGLDITILKNEDIGLELGHLPDIGLERDHLLEQMKSGDKNKMICMNQSATDKQRWHMGLNTNKHTSRNRTTLLRNS